MAYVLKVVCKRPKYFWFSNSRV